MNRLTEAPSNLPSLTADILPTFIAFGGGAFPLMISGARSDLCYGLLFGAACLLRQIDSK